MSEPVVAVADTARQERLYRSYCTFFDRAERERRWNPLSDVPYEQINRDAPESLVVVAETFCCVESYLPDYVSSGIGLMRPYFGQAWFTANWAYEESKHALALMEYLMRSGRRTPEQVFDLQNRLRTVAWRLPFDTVRRMTIYGVFQEQATFVIYARQEKRARELGDGCLATIFRLSARDERAHAGFYQEVVRVMLEEDRAGTIADIGLVARSFEMPGVRLVPDYERRVEVMREEGRMDRGVFFAKVLFPVLAQLGVTRREIMGHARNEHA